MAYHYTDESREREVTALPDVEVFYHDGRREHDTWTCPDYGQYVEPGWYYVFGFPGCLWDGEPTGPYATEDEALQAAREDAGF